MASRSYGRHHALPVSASRLYDYYAAIDDFCVRLRTARRDSWADRLHDAKAGGGMSGEILSHTGATLQAFVAEESDRDLRAEAARLLSECDALWRS